jgi:[ribosomal protein S5]-alanine N-acetyltransferase
MVAAHSRADSAWPETQVKLETPRLVLREFVPGDWRAVLAYQSDARYLRYYAWERRTAEEVQAFIQRFVSWQEQIPRTRFQLAITLADGGALIGNCGIRQAEPGGPVAELGYELDPAHWGRGYASEATSAMLAFAFVDLGLHRVWGECIAENSASRKVMERRGMRLEGRLRENRWFKGRWWDTLIYGILDREWEAQEGGR